MSEETFRLPDEHLETAKQIATAHVRRRGCRACYGRGWMGLAQDNTIVLCHKCVDEEAALQAWKEHVAAVPELRVHYPEFFTEADGGGEA